jgi:hypothetical protein
MADRPQDPPRYAGHVVRRMLLRRNIAVDEDLQVGRSPLRGR